jgi:hypothetical protein
MESLATILSITSGFILMGYPGPAANVIATSLFINVLLAPVTAVISSRRDRSAVLWLILGLVFGMWALAASLLIRARRSSTLTRPPAPGFGPPSDAA